MYLPPAHINFGKRGAALVAVLGVIVVITMLLIALLSLVNTENRSTHAFGDSTEVRSLAEWPTNLVIGQLRAGTDSLDGTRTWASQPGMIRTFGTKTDAITGRAKLDTAYKLYSARRMIEVNEFDPAAEAPPANWRSQEAHFVDLNEPVYVERDGELVQEFPIIHGNAVQAEIDGFSVESAVGATGDQPIPMPVRWIYVLEDGSMAMPDQGGDGEEAKFSGDNPPTTDNPIVGRIAFWTDDESSKVNINTASEGTYWDIPRANTHFDAYVYADRQPVRNEFQRYPGHPATTSLSSVLGPYLGINPEIYTKLAPFVEHGGSRSGTKEVDGNTPPVTLDSDRLYASVDEFYFSARGTLGDGNRELNSEKIAAEVSLQPEQFRSMLEETRFLLTAHSRSPEVNLFDRPRISLWPIQHDEGDRNVVDRLFAFCSETRQSGEDSRLPYYFQRHRTHDLSQKDLEKGYGSSQSPTEDFENIPRNRELYDYLTTLTEKNIPGFGDNFKDKYPLDQEQILTEMVDYCRSGLNTMALGLPTDNHEDGYFYVPPRQVVGTNAVAGEGQVLPLKIEETMGFGRSVTITEAALVFYPSKRDEEKTIRVDFPGRNKNLPSGYRASEVKAFLMLEFFTPSPGLPAWSPNIAIRIEGMENWTLDDKNMNFPKDATLISNALIGLMGGVNGAGHTCAHMNLFQPFFYTAPNEKNKKRYTLVKRDMDSQDPIEGYAWHSMAPITIPVPEGENTKPPEDDDDTLEFGGGPIRIVISDPTESEVVQTIEMNFPATEIPVPYAWSKQGGEKPAAPHAMETSLNRRVSQGHNPNAVGRNSNNFCDYLIRPGDVVRSMEVTSALKGPGSERLPGGDLRIYAATPEVPETWFQPGGELPEDGEVSPYFRPKRRFAMGLRNGNYWQYWGNFRVEDRREHGLDAIAGGHDFHPYFRQSAYRTAGAILEHTSGYSFKDNDPSVKDTKLYRDAHPLCARGQVAAFRIDMQPGDWDQGVGSNEDGATINKPDETNSSRKYKDWGPAQRGGYYQRGYFNIDPNGVNYSPNRQIASPVMFGSLSTGIKAIRPWETLLFCPNPAGRETESGTYPNGDDHIGFSFPRDHLFLDLFWMPVTEPYAISEPFSTAGKINMNYEIMPFRYIKRRTGIRAVLDSIHILAIPEIALARHPHNCIKGGRDQAYRQSVRYGISTNTEDGTLRGFEKRFEEGDVFRSASEICDIQLVPEKFQRPQFPYPETKVKATYDTMTKWWRQFRATGDNAREAPYNHIFPRLTTQSNVFQVHYRVQLLKNPRDQAPDQWSEQLGAVLGEYRGSTLLERYIDPNDPAIPDFATVENETLSPHYRFRIIRKKQFSP